MIIGVDMGHTLSGLGTGAVGIVKETDQNRKIGNELISLLKSKGHTVINCTVDTSTQDLADRVYLANKQTLDVFVSIHLNSGGGTGTETYIYDGYWSGKEANRAIAKKVNDKIVANCGFKNRGVKEANFHVLRETVAHAILVEVCFVDSQSDVSILNTSKVAKAIAEGLTGQSFETVAPPVNEMYRIRLTWANATSQKGAFSNLDNAIAECKKYAGYSVFNNAGIAVFTNSPATAPVPTPSTDECDNIIENRPEIGGSGIFTVTEPVGIKFRNKPCVVHGVVQDMYYFKESVVYDRVIQTPKYTWISWIGAGNARRYMPVRDKSNGEVWGTFK